MITLLPVADDPFPWLALLGRSHPLVLHLPLGLIPAMFVLEFGAAMFRRPAPRGAVLTLAWLCALSAAMATASGLVLGGEGDYAGDTVGNHKIAGIVLGSLCLIAAIAACFARRTAFRIVLLLCCAAMVPAGHLGGSITHGPNFLFEPLEKPRERAGRTTDDAAANAAANGTGKPAKNAAENVAVGAGENPPNDPAPNVPAPNVTDPISVDPNTTVPPPVSEFVAVIQPILERTCYKCHNPDKTKAELLLTTPEGIMAGSEYGAVVVPGKPEESELITRLLLPIDDEDHMPPEGKPQPTKSEIEQLRAWIAAGCKFD